MQQFSKQELRNLDKNFHTFGVEEVLKCMIETGVFMETTKMTHEEIAQYLKINPEELEKMEQSYQMSCMDFKEDFFDYGAKDVNSSELTEISTVLEALIERIVKELLQETIILGMDGKAEPFLCEKPIPVTKEEIMRLPENLRPQLTGRYVERHSG